MKRPAPEKGAGPLPEKGGFQVTTTLRRKGRNVVMSGRFFFLPQERANLVIEIKNSDFQFRFLTLFLDPDSDQIDVESIFFKRKGDVDDTRMLQGDPVNIKQIMNDGRQANGPFLLEALDNVQRDTEVTFTILNREAIDGVLVNIALEGKFAELPTTPEERVDIQNIQVRKAPIQRRAQLQPQVGPLNGGRRRGNPYPPQGNQGYPNTF